MKTNQQGLDLLIAREGKRNDDLHECALPASPDFVDQGVGDAVVIGDLNGSMPFKQAAPYAEQSI